MTSSESIAWSAASRSSATACTSTAKAAPTRTASRALATTVRRVSPALTSGTHTKPSVALPERAAQHQVRGAADHGGQPERHEPVGENGDERHAGRLAEGREGADHPAFDPTDAAGERKQVAEHPDEVAHHQHRRLRRRAERVEP